MRRGRLSSSIICIYKEILGRCISMCLVLAARSAGSGETARRVRQALMMVIMIVIKVMMTMMLTWLYETFQGQFPEVYL